jgi:negative regulator of flagellin synthesis FlgM
MDFRSGLDGLKSLLGVTPASPSGSSPARTGGPTKEAGAEADRATLSSAGSEMAQSAADSGVRMEKVESIQAALAAGTYSVPASAVASRMLDAMLAASR